jgi:hypothetical protein
MSWRHIGGWRYSSTILDLSTRWRWVVSFTPLPLYPRGNSPRYPLDRRVGGRKVIWTREKIHCPCRKSNPNRPAHELCQLQILSGRNFVSLTYSLGRSQWPRSLRHELPSLARTLGSWVPIPLEVWMSVCVYSGFVLFCVLIEALRRADHSPTDCV